MRPQPRDPFEPVSLQIEYVDSAAGSRKTTLAVALAVEAAQRGQKTIFAMPTEDVIQEWANTARRLDPAVRVDVITSKSGARTTVPQTIADHIAAVNSGHILFITHVGLVLVTGWPRRINEYHLVIDEVLEVILTRKPLRLRFSWFQLLWFADIAAMPATLPERQSDTGWTEKDQAEFERGVEILNVYQRLMDPAYNAAPGEIEMAEKHAPLLMDRLRELQAKRQAAEERAAPYYRIVSKPDDKRPNDPHWQTKLRARSGERDQVYEGFQEIAQWLEQGVPLFTDMSRWNTMIGVGLQPRTINLFGLRLTRPGRRPYDAGLITITGFRRPDFLTGFQRVTIMSALFKHTMLYAVWDKLGVDFVPSTWIPLAVPTVPLGDRRLRIYWLTESWSKKRRNRSGGIGNILELIKSKGVIDPDKTVCVVLNKDDGDAEKDGVVKPMFPNAMVLPHNTRGQNKWRDYDQLIYCAALNSFTPDIRFLEQVLGIDALNQRIARLGQEVYQTIMRLSLREPTAAADITVVVMDKNVAEWLPQWFEPADQVEVSEIDASGVIKLHGGAGGRPVIGERPMTAAERQRRSRLKRRGDEPSPPP